MVFLALLAVSFQQPGAKIDEFSPRVFSPDGTRYLVLTRERWIEDNIAKLKVGNICLIDIFTGG